MIGHVDCDCYYVSAERVRFPHLRGVPVGVLGNHGACIIAKSYEAKAAGVTTGMPIWEALPICPDGVYVKRDFAWYEVLSRRLLALVRQTSPRVEFYSIDEMFFHAPGADRGAALALQRAIARRVGVPASIGVAPTKTLAKLISDSVKPCGAGVVASEADRRRLLEGLPVTEIAGVATRSAEKLAAHGIATCDQFAAADRAFIRWLLTKTGEDLWWELNGTPVLDVLPICKPRKFVARGGSIGRPSRDRERVAAFVVRNVERLVEALNHDRICCDTLALELSFRETRSCAVRCTMPGGTAELSALRDAALWLLPRTWRPATATVRYMHVVAGGLRPWARRQRSLFEDARPKAERAEQVQHAINAAVGRFAVRSAATLPLADVYGDLASSYDICDIYGKSCF
ncbi:MAG: nucleotidyltransferase [Pirellulales bacterium]|nr:nucleotidyltransferase [Pirellulales bacterium]